MHPNGEGHRHGPDREGPVDEVAGRILASSKYRHLEPTFVHRIAAESVQAAPDLASAAKLAKRRLHQAFGAFVVGKPVVAIRRAHAAASANPADLRAAFVAAMRTHASSAERIPYLEDYGALIHEWCGTPSSVLDLACGLGPLAIPWLSLAPAATYCCCDIDLELVAALGELDDVLPVHLTAESRDLVGDPPAGTADLCLGLKMITTLEQQGPGRGAAVLGGLASEHVVVSMPRRSLGGSRRYLSDPVAQVTTMAGASYDLIAERVLGAEHYMHLVRPDR